MVSNQNTLVIPGNFVEVAEELAQYLDVIRKESSNNNAAAGPSVQDEIAPILSQLREQAEASSNEDQDKKAVDEVVKKIVQHTSELNTAPEKDITGAYNLLIFVVSQSSDPSPFLPTICKSLTEPFPSSPHNGSSLALSILSNVFNVLEDTDANRYIVFLSILHVIRSTQSTPAFNALKQHLETKLPSWIEEWKLSPQDTQKLHLAISDAAKDSGDVELSYSHSIAALQAIPPSEAANPDALKIAESTLVAALTLPFVFDFIPLTSSEAVQSLRSSEPLLFELLEIFATDTLDAYEDFIAANPLSSIRGGALVASAETLQTKMRLLTLASRAASTPSRSLSYDGIASALRVPVSDVEMWVTDTIRAGLVEGKLSQLKGEFLVQRATYRVFGDKQWAEVQGRLMVWRHSLEKVLRVIKSEKEKLIREE